MLTSTVFVQYTVWPIVHITVLLVLYEQYSTVMRIFGQIQYSYHYVIVKALLLVCTENTAQGGMLRG